MRWAHKKRENAVKSTDNIDESHTNDGGIERGWWKQSWYVGKYLRSCVSRTCYHPSFIATPQFKSCKRKKQEPNRVANIVSIMQNLIWKQNHGQISIGVKSWLASKGITIEGLLPIMLREFVRNRSIKIWRLCWPDYTKILNLNEVWALWHSSMILKFQHFWALIFWWTLLLWKKNLLRHFCTEVENSKLQYLPKSLGRFQKVMKNYSLISISTITPSMRPPSP